VKKRGPQHKNPGKILSQSLAEGKRVIGIVGSDATRRNRAVDYTEKTLRKKVGSLEIVRLTESEILIDQLANTLFSSGLFCEARLVILSEIATFKKHTKNALLQLLQRDISPHTLLLLSTPLSRSDPVETFLKKNDTLVSFQILTPPEMRQWAQKELTRQGLLDTEEQAINALLALSEGDLDKLLQYIEQISLYLEPNAHLTKSVVEKLFGSHSSFREFELLEALSTRNEVRYLQLVRHLLHEGKSPLMLLGILSKALRTYHHIIAAHRTQMSESAIQETLNLKPWLFQKYSHAAKAFHYAQLQRAHLYLMQADALMKNRSAGPEAILMNLFQHLKG
jgi:DNA polymerase III delta subunit